MNFVENNGKKVAAVLCVASCLPVVATVYAMETEPGWHGDKYINEDTTVAKGWQEIEGKNYYFSEENGAVDAAATREAVVASISSYMDADVQETVSNLVNDVVNAHIEAIETEEAEEPAVEAVEPEEIIEDAPVVEDAEVVAPEIEVEQEYETEEEVFTPVVDVPAYEDVVAPEETLPEIDESEFDTPEMGAPEIVEPEYPEEEVEYPDYSEPETEAPEVVEPEVVVPEEEVEQPSWEEEVYPEDEPEVEVETPAYPEYEDVVTPEPEPVIPEAEEPAAPEEPEVSAPVAEDLNTRISNAAQALVGVTDGMQCTEVVQLALANAGVSDAMQLWPDQYASTYGYYTSNPVAGNLIYYNNGGRGVDHIAIYIGGGMAVHGNYNGRTVIASVNVPGGAPQYIQVVR